MMLRKVEGGAGSYAGGRAHGGDGGDEIGGEDLLGLVS